MNIVIDNDKISVSFSFNAETINKVKRAGMKWNPKSKTWESTFSYHVLNGLTREFPELEIPGPEILTCDFWEPSTYLMAHQKEAAEIALKYPRYGFFDDTGVGKTLEAIEIVKQKRLKTLVVCPLSIIENAWMRDVQNFTPELKVVNLWEAFKKRKKVPEHNIGIINFEGFKNNLKKLDGYEMVMVDESSKCKDARSQITKALIAYTDRIPFVYLFSGTPAPNNEMEYWSQFRIIDQFLLGKSYYSFRNNFCYAGGFGGYIWKMRPDKREEFLELIGMKSRVIRKEDVLDLPERTFNIRTIYLDAKEREAYNRMEADLIFELENLEIENPVDYRYQKTIENMEYDENGNCVENYYKNEEGVDLVSWGIRNASQEGRVKRAAVAANSAVKIMKLRQGTSGFYYDEDGKAIVVGHSKLDALKELLGEIGNHQVIIWFQFHFEADQIQNFLLEKCTRVDGTISSQDLKNESVRSFVDGRSQYLISHPASLGHGVTLTNCQYAVYFSLSHSHENHYQSKDRIYRKGQKNACTYYYLIADKTVDGEILKCLENKANTAEAVFAYLKRNRG